MSKRTWLVNFSVMIVMLISSSLHPVQAQSSDTAIKQPLRQTSMEQVLSHTPNDPLEGCPSGKCDYVAGEIVIKINIDKAKLDVSKGLDGIKVNGLAAGLADAGILNLQPIFPSAIKPVLSAEIETANGQRIAKPDLTQWYLARINQDQDVFNAVDAVKKLDNVAWAEPNYLRKPAEKFAENSSNPATSENQRTLALPNSTTDPLYAQQWHLGATHIPETWAYLESQGLPAGGSRDILVAVIDTGVDYTHPDLAANIWTNPVELMGLSGVDDDADGYIDDIHGVDTVAPDGDPMDDQGHGTHVAGIIAAQSGNGLGGVGIAYNVQILPIKASQYSGTLSAVDIAEGINYAIEKGADVINMSFGGYTRSQIEEDALAIAFGQAVLVAAAGNDQKPNQPCGIDFYPAAYNWVLGVMASDIDNNLTSFTNYECGPRDTHEYELMAPGIDVWSALPGSQFAAWDGTSMSAPVVSGIAALARTRWADKNLYSSRFIMGQIASNASPLANALTALTVAPKPNLNYLQYFLFDTAAQSANNDGDGIVDSGETIDLAITIRNQWGKADPVSVMIEPLAEGTLELDPYVTIITDTVDYGAVGSFSQDDNGLITDSGGAIIGVSHPFRFTLSADTPNNHEIPFLVTMQARNGMANDDPTLYTFTSRFSLISQRGVELPRFIDHDMTLTKDNFWIVTGQTLIQSGITLTVTEGTQIQFGAPPSGDPYQTASRPLIQNEGTLIISGTEDQPVDIFPLTDTMCVRFANLGTAEMHYARIQNPSLVYRVSNQFTKPFTLIDHSTLNIGKGDSYDASYIAANTITHSQILQPEIRDFRFFPGNTSESLITYIPATSNGYLSIGNTANEYMNAPVSISDSVLLGSFYFDTHWSGGFYNIYNNAEAAAADTKYIRNAFLNNYNLNTNKWVQFYARERGTFTGFANNFWATTSTTLIDAAIRDFYDDINLGFITYQPILTAPPATAYPFVAAVTISDSNGSQTPVVGAETATFTVQYNRDMDPSIQPSVSFGPTAPYTDQIIEGNWFDARTWVGTFNISPVTGDGYQYLRLSGGRAADDHWLVPPIDAGRFRFEIITSGTVSMNLQATGGEGLVDLMWTQDDFPLLAGYNLYRSTSAAGPFTRINTTILPPEVHAFRDTSVAPGIPYYYLFTVIKSDMTESNPSNLANGTPLDTVPPVIGHTPVTSATVGLPLTFSADVTDNVRVATVNLFYRPSGTQNYTMQEMVHTSGSRHTTTLDGSHVTVEGIDYYIEASDGTTIARTGRPENPYHISIADRPAITVITPAQGPAAGGTAVTISGANFKLGAAVSFGGTPAANVVVVSSNQITCTTPAHLAAVVDVKVINPGGASGTYLRGYTFISETASISIPQSGGGQNSIAYVPVNLANAQGLAAASLTITYDPAVLTAQGATNGSLTPGWALVVNSSTPGRIILSMASTGAPVTGSGVLVHLAFDVIGVPGATSALQFSNVSLNDGAIPSDTLGGTFQVDQVYSISGSVHYWNGNAIVPGVALTLVGDRVYTGLSNSLGKYTVSGAADDVYTLTPTKTDGVKGITAYDASLALQHDAQLITLTSNAAIAADVNDSNSITSMDAYYILQKAIDQDNNPFPGVGVVWKFLPAERSFVNLYSNVSGQDFMAVLIGDVSGSWAAGEPSQAANASAAAASLTLNAGKPDENDIVEVDVSLDPNSYEVFSLDARLVYDQTHATLIDLNFGDVNNWLMAYNDRGGIIHLAIAGAQPLSDREILVKMRFRLNSTHKTSTLKSELGSLNEGAIPLTMTSTTLGSHSVYFPYTNR